MNNPFDIEEDNDTNWINIDVETTDQEKFDNDYDRILATSRTLYQKTNEAITYLKTADKHTLYKAEQRLLVEELMKQQQYTPQEIEEDKKLHDALISYITSKSITPPKNLEETIALVESDIHTIPPIDYDTLSDYNGVIPHTYAHYLRQLAKYVWDVKQERKEK